MIANFQNQKLNEILKLITLSLLIFLYLTFIIWNFLVTNEPPVGDLAADMLLTNRISDEGYLLIGHYSRFQFNHPGPFWFYYNKIFEIILSWLNLSRTQEWQIGSIFINTILIIFSTRSLYHYLYNSFSFTFSLLSSLFIVNFVGLEITNLWMPCRLITPYLAFMVCILQITEGKFRYIPPAVLLTSILIHGYITMPIFTIPFLGIAGVIGYMTSQQPFDLAGIIKIVIASVIVGLFFVTPMLLEYMLHAPSNFSKIIEINASLKEMDRPTWQAISNFISELVLFNEKALGWLISIFVIPMIMSLSSLTSDTKRKLFTSMAILLCISLLMIIFYKNTPAPIYPFIAKFYVSIPPLLLLIIFAITFEVWPNSINCYDVKTNRIKLYKCVLIFISGIVFSFPLLFNLPFKQLLKHESDFSVIDLSNKIQSIYSDKIISIDYAHHEQWPFIAGLLLELNRRNIPACTTWRHMAFLYTSGRVCSPNAISDIIVIPSGECSKDCFIKSGANALKNGLARQIDHLPNLTPGEIVSHDSDAVVYLNWSRAEKSHRWSSGSESTILFSIDKFRHNYLGKINIQAFLLGNQRVTIHLNSKKIYSAALTDSTGNIFVEFDSNIFLDGKNTLEFHFPDARMPDNRDSRVLALSLKNFEIR